MSSTLSHFRSPCYRFIKVTYDLRVIRARPHCVRSTMAEIRAEKCVVRLFNLKKLREGGFCSRMDGFSVEKCVARFGRKCVILDISRFDQIHLCRVCSNSFQNAHFFVCALLCIHENTFIISQILSWDKVIIYNKN